MAHYLRERQLKQEHHLPTDESDILDQWQETTLGENAPLVALASPIEIERAGGLCRLQWKSTIITKHCARISGL